MFQMMGVFAEFERSMIQERIKAGLARARANGKTLGGRQLPDGVQQAVILARTEGATIRAIAKNVGVSVGAVHGIVKAAGLPKAKVNRKTLGRCKLADKVRQAVLQARSEGASMRTIAKNVGVSTGTVNVILKAARSTTTPM